MNDSSWLEAYVKTSDVAKVFSVSEAQIRLEQLMEAASKAPVEIAAADGCTAYLVSKHDFDAMVSTVDALTDQLWRMRAELARKGGFVGAEEMKEMVSKLEDAANADADAHERR